MKLQSNCNGFILPTMLFGIAITATGLALALQLMVTSWRLEEEYRNYVEKRRSALTEDFINTLLLPAPSPPCAENLCILRPEGKPIVFPVRVDETLSAGEHISCTSRTTQINTVTTGIIHPYTCNRAYSIYQSVLIGGNLINEHTTISAIQNPTVLIDGLYHGDLVIEGSGSVTILAAGDLRINSIATKGQVSVRLISATGSVVISAVDTTGMLSISARDTISLPAGYPFSQITAPGVLQYDRLILSRLVQD